ncbi:MULTISPECIES: aminopeptidase N [unclassified Microbacterium]|uniref:aminopeptidase N n=1 Tax=unclassified Microbacterium TaxID=2609290 RepID=UPI000EAA0BFF|nr:MULTISPECIES: aminopeptidase N [unclassified Microbacterium]MBT2485666.1 aminopeptidase N [Microbacterium sp. ISL-108]RKN68442.1 aminopeptidase N [Microbacterium sp. CGR2]
MHTANLSRDETAARSAAVTVHGIRVELDLTGAPERARTGFPTTTTLEFDATTDATWIDFIGEGVHRVVVNGVDQDVNYDGARIRLSGLAATNVVRVEAVGAYSRTGEGLHRFHDPADDATYLYTQYEPADARRVMACFEQPDMKAAYTFVVDAPSGWEVLSNQGAERVDVGVGVQRVEFAPTLPISSYITAVAAGPYARVTGEWQRGDQSIALGLFARRSLAQYMESEEILDVTRQGLDFFTEAFAYPYPWGKYDQIFVPEYNLGAMENPGLVTFTEAYLSRGAATDAQRAARANTVLHEMAHMWFGDLVTMKWWDDLWLKESFADYMGAHASAVATRFHDAWVKFAANRKAWAYQQDQLPTTHPIVADIADLEAAKLNFDGITYAKGAAVLKQLVAFVGDDAFFEGARRYFAANAFGNTTLEDFLVELSAVSGRDMSDWSQAWLQTSGVSALWMETDAEGQRFLMQTDPRPHRLRIGLYDRVEGRVVRREQIEQDVIDERTPVDLPSADLVLLNDDDLTYVKARLDERSLDTVEQSLSSIEDPLARALVWSSLWNATRDGEFDVTRYLSIVREHAPAEPNIGLLAGILANASFALRHFLDGARRADEQSRWTETAWSALQAAEAGGDAQLSWARALATASAHDDARHVEVRAMLDGSVPDGLVVDPDLRWQLLTALVTRGHADAADIAAEQERDDTGDGHTAARRALASRPDAPVRRAAWDAAWNDDSLSNDQLGAEIAGFRAGGRRDLIEAFDEDYFARLTTTWRARSIEIAKRLVVGMFPATDSLTLVDGWLAANEDAPSALRRLVVEQRDHLARDLRVRSLSTAS